MRRILAKFYRSNHKDCGWEAHGRLIGRAFTQAIQDHEHFCTLELKNVFGPWFCFSKFSHQKQTAILNKANRIIAERFPKQTFPTLTVRYSRWRKKPLSIILKKNCPHNEPIIWRHVLKIPPPTVITIT